MQIRQLGRVDYLSTWERMRSFTLQRGSDAPDELWLCEHAPVFTQGVAGKPEHVLDRCEIPLVQTDRGGQVTYHGPGQVVAYPLVDLRRLRLHVKEYVFRLETALVQTLEGFGVTGHRVSGAPGIYVQLAAPRGHAALAGRTGGSWQGLGKIAALGIKVTHGCAYHGVALNVAMDLQPFTRINPCGHAGLATVDLATLGIHATWADAADSLARRLVAHLAAPPPA